MKYTFGTNLKAADRLEEIAKFFNPLAFKVIKKYCLTIPNTAIDIGCGPGFATDMVASATLSPNVYGLDNSNEFLNFASKRFPQNNYIKHDITSIPFPLSADFMYCRFVLSHLKDPISCVNKWISQLNTNGLIFMDELENISTDNEVFNKYISINDSLVKSQGASLYVGKIISEGKYSVAVLLNKCNAIPVNDSQAAKWFYPNTVTIWQNNDIVSKYLRFDEISYISDSLKQLIESDSINSNTTWYMRRMILKKESRRI